MAKIYWNCRRKTGPVKGSSWHSSIRWKSLASVTKFFLQTALNAVRSYRGEESLDRFDFQDLMEEKIALLKMPEDLLTRSVNVGFFRR